MTRLSVIIPGYNTPEHWWRRCVESVIATGAEEIICVDDGSSVRPAFLSAYPVRVIYRERNGGLATARNTALKVATGDFVTFVDSDDEVRPHTFRRCTEALTESGADIAIYGVNVVWPDDGLQKTDTFDRAEVFERLEPKEILDFYNRCLLNYSCNKVYRRSFLVAHNLSFNKNGMPCEDIIFNLHCIMAGAKVCTVPYVGYIYYRTRGTLLSCYKPTQAKGSRIASEVWRKYKDSVSGARAVLGDLGETTASQELLAEWRNMWMPGSPYSLKDRWKWLRQHSELGGMTMLFKTMFFLWLRRCFYWRCVRRWHTLRIYPRAFNWSVGDEK